MPVISSSLSMPLISSSYTPSDFIRNKLLQYVELPKEKMLAQKQEIALFDHLTDIALNKELEGLIQDAKTPQQAAGVLTKLYKILLTEKLVWKANNANLISSLLKNQEFFNKNFKKILGNILTHCLSNVLKNPIEGLDEINSLLKAKVSFFENDKKTYKKINEFSEAVEKKRALLLSSLNEIKNEKNLEESVNPTEVGDKNLGADENTVKLKENESVEEEEIFFDCEEYQTEVEQSATGNNKGAPLSKEVSESILNTSSLSNYTPEEGSESIFNNSSLSNYAFLCLTSVALTGLAFILSRFVASASE